MNFVRQWLATFIAALCGLLLGACASTVSGTPLRVTAGGSGGDDLTAMLLSVEDIRLIVGVPDLEVHEEYNDVPDTSEFSTEGCAGVPFNTVIPAYHDSGYQAVRGMNVRSPEEFPELWVDEGVIRFDDVDDARRFMTDAEATWRGCAGTVTSTVPEDSERQFWTIGDTTESGGLLRVVSSLRGDEDYVCSRAMKDGDVLVIDVVVCSRNVTDEAETIVNRIAGRLPV